MGTNKLVPFILLMFCVVFTSGSLTANEAMNFLAQYKYLDETVAKAAVQPGEVPAGIVTEAIRKFQEMANLPVTGILDQETLLKMEQPRCGVADVSANGHLKFVVSGKRWPKKLLTWKISAYSRTSTLTEHEQRDAIERALQLWGRQTPLRFQYQTQGTADLNFKFAVGNHGDNEPFDGPDGVLGHAYQPTRGEIHFDDQETWLLGVDDTKTGSDLYIMAAHEIGHALGLKHSKLSQALMAPYVVFSTFKGLHQDDVAGIQDIYGKNHDCSFQRM